MRTRDRMIVFGVGFLIGMVIVSMLLSRRAARESAAVDPWVAHNRAVLEDGARPLPEGVHESIREGRIIGYGTMPEDSPRGAGDYVWLLNFDESYPYVRLVESADDGTLSYMAADQVTIALRPDVDVTALQPMLEALGLRLRMFNRKQQVAVVGVLDTEIDAVPRTLEALAPYAEDFESAAPDYIRFQPKAPF